MEYTVEDLREMKKRLFIFILKDEWKAFEMGNKILKVIRRKEKEEAIRKKWLEETMGDMWKDMQGTFPWLNEFETVVYEEEQEDLGWELFGFLEKMTGLAKRYRLENMNGNAEQIVEAIAGHLEHRSTLDAAAAQLAMDKNEMGHILKKKTGMTAAQYCSMLKMRRAAIYLKESALDVPQVAQQLGYASEERFSKVFGDKYGCSPKQYRKNV